MRDAIRKDGVAAVLRRAAAAALVVTGISAGSASATSALPEPFTFSSIEGGEIGFADWAGQPVLVTNTASLCAFASQYGDLQELYDAHRAEGLVVLAVPSDDFRQELADEAAVREFCQLTFGLDLPMTVISHVRGEDAHPFYGWLAATHDIVPRWNFHKVLIGRDGEVLGHWGPAVRPSSPAIRRAVQDALAK